MRLQKRLNIALTVALTIAFILLGTFVFRVAYCRTFEGLIDLYGSFKYYFCVLFGFPVDGIPSVAERSKVLKWDVILPANFETFKANCISFFRLFISEENFLSWLNSTGGKAGVWAKIFVILLPCILAVIIAIKRLYAKGNTKHNVDTIPLRVFKKISAVTYQPTKRFICSYIDFLREHSWIWISWLIMWAFHLNLASIEIEFFAYYFFFSVSFRVDTIYTQFVKLAIDLQPFFCFFPWWALRILAYVLFEHWRKKFALNKLRKCEAKNCGFINALPIVSMTCGSMGKRKTTMITDMALSQEVMFRQKAFDILQKADMKFPYFPWICFEKELASCIEYGTVYNLATVKEWVNLKRSRYEKHGNALWQLYGYDCQRYGLTYNDALKTSGLFDVLETYAQAFFIYALETSLIVANYSIRTDNQILTEDNFPLWALDFFTDGQRQSRHSHILDFDVLRLGKKIFDNTPKAGSFEFGVVAITEIGKERGNNLELKEVKKKKKVEKVEVADLSQTDAQAWCNENGFKFSKEEDFSDSVAEGGFISQSPAAGTQLEKGSTVTVHYSKGKEPTMEDKNALAKAEGYSSRMHMSKAAIYDQLTSSYGEGFPPEAAQYAVDHLVADYKKNALEKAKSYQTNMHMSRSAIYDQLTSSYGEQFTAEEAQYAVDNLPQ